MKSVFADTFYFLALLNERDAAHERAVAASRAAGLFLVTTEFVLIEPQQRDEVLALCNLVETDPVFTLIRATTELIQRGRKLYRDRADKEWPLTDCISFVVMQDHALSEAFTADHHFVQAGFKALLA